MSAQAENPGKRRFGKASETSSSQFGQEVARIAEGSPSALPMICGILAAFLGLALALVFGLSYAQVLASGMACGVLVACTLSWAFAECLVLYEDAVVVSSKLRRQVVLRSNIEECTWSRSKTFHRGLLSGFDFSWTSNTKMNWVRSKSFNFAGG